MIENSRLEGMIELFSDDASGSGQIFPTDLNKVFHFDESNANDLKMISQVIELRSYDI